MIVCYKLHWAFSKIVQNNSRKVGAPFFVLRTKKGAPTQNIKCGRVATATLPNTIKNGRRCFFFAKQKKTAPTKKLSVAVREANGHTLIFARIRPSKPSTHKWREIFLGGSPFRRPTPSSTPPHAPIFHFEPSTIGIPKSICLHAHTPTPSPPSTSPYPPRYTSLKTRNLEIFVLNPHDNCVEE